MIQLTARFILLCTISLFSYLAEAQTAKEYNEQAKQANSRGDNDGIITAATLSLNVSLNGEAYWWRAIGYYNKKNYTLAISDITKALTYYSGTKSSLGRLYVLRGDSKFYSQNYDGAIDDYELAFTYEVTDKKRVYSNLITCFKKIEYDEEAIPYYNDLIKLETNSLELSKLFYGRAVAKSYSADYKTDNILSDLNSAIEKNRQNTDALYDRGAIYYGQKKNDLVKADFNAIIKILEPKSKTKLDSSIMNSCYVILGALAHDLGKYEEATTNYVKGLQYNSKNGIVYWNLAKIKSEIDKSYDQASSYYMKAVQLLDSKVDISKCYVDYFIHERRFLKFNKAMEAIDAAISVESNNASHYWNKAYLYRIKNNTVEALKNYNKAISLGISDSAQRSRLYLERGRFKLKTSDVQGALLDIQTAIALKPSFDNYMALGEVFKTGMKQTEIANGNFQKAMAYTISGTQNKDTSSNYAYAAAAMGDRKTAERFIKKMIIDASAKMGALANEYHNAACIYTTLGDIPKALIYLELSLQADYSDFEHMLHDQDLEPLYMLSEYKNLLIKYKVPVPVY